MTPCMNSSNTPISDSLRGAIRDCGVTLYRLSQLSEIELSTLTRFMNGEAGLNIESINRLCYLLKLELIQIPKYKPILPPGRKRGRPKKGEQ